MSEPEAAAPVPSRGAGEVLSGGDTSAGEADRSRRRAAKSARSARRRADQLLCGEGVGVGLGASSRIVAGWMREAGVTEPLTNSKLARRWRVDPDLAPDWLRVRLLERAAQIEARRVARERAEQRHREADTARFNAAAEQVWHMLGDPTDRKLRHGHWLDRHHHHQLALEDIAFRAAKDCGLASGNGNPDWLCLNPQEQEALRLCGFSVPSETAINQLTPFTRPQP